MSGLDEKLLDEAARALRERTALGQPAGDSYFQGGGGLDEQLLDEAANALRERDREAASLSLQSVDDINPDDAAKARSVAKSLGAPTSLIDLDVETAARELKIKQDRDALADRPKAQRFFSDPDKAKLASDDVSTLGLIEQTVTGAPQALASGALQPLAEAPGGIADLSEAYRRFEDQLLGPTDPNSILGGFDALKNLALRAFGGELKDLRKSVELDEKDRNYILDVVEATGQVGTQAAVTILNPGLGFGLLTGQGASETKQILDGINKGTQNERDLALFGGALVTGVLEKIGIDKLIDGIGLGKNIKNRATRFFVERFATGAAIEATEETLEAAARDAIIAAIVDPDREIFEDFTAYDATVAGGAGGLFRSLLGIRRSRTSDEDTRRQIELARQSKLLARDPEAFEEFYQSLVDGTESDEVRLSVEGIVNELNQTGGDPVEFLQALGVDLAEAQKALDNGGDISVNRGRFVTEIAGSEGRDDILRHVRAEDMALTVAEAETESAAIQERVAEAVKQFEETGEMPTAPTPEIAAQAEEIGRRIADQIDKTGNYTRAGSRAIGSVYEALFRTIASDYAAEGKDFDLEAVAADLGVDVRSIPFADRASPVTGDETLGAPQAVEQSGFEDYRGRVDPDGRTIPAEDRPNLGMGDMYGMLPEDAEVVSELNDGITIYRGPNGDYYATALNPDLGEQDVVGYIQGGDNGTELAVVQEMQGRGIGSELQYLFRRENPFAPTGGLTEAGARRLEGTYNRLYDEGVITPEELDLQQTAREFDVSPEALRAELDAAGGDMTQTPRFKEWFGDSKIVDEQGAPIVVYHGSQSDIEAFSPTAIYPADRQEYMEEFGQAGVYFTADPNYAATYAQGGATPSIYPVYLSLQNPLVISEPTFWESIKAVVTGGGDKVTETSYIPRSRIDELEAEGYDGIINPNANEIIAFEPTQIKSAFNRGTFDRTDPRILEQSPDFQAFIEGSLVVDENGAPLKVYRGEHGEVTGSVTTLLPSITFTDDPSEASLYAEKPNQSAGTRSVAPRVSEAYLSIKNPIINQTRDRDIESMNADPFMDFDVLIDALGLEKTIEIVRSVNEQIPIEESIGRWDDEFADEFDSLEDLLERDPERLAELYNYAWAVLDDPIAVEALKQAGYDGAIHGGFGGVAGSTEYRVFDESQIRSTLSPNELFQRDEGLQQDGGHQFRISTRLPTTKRAEEDPVAENLIVDLEAMRFKPEAFKHNMDLLKTYPGFSTRSRNPDKIAEEFIEFTVDNLLYLFDSVPPETRQRSKLWYDGARALSERLAEDHGIPVQSVAAVMAALSPQKDWYQNASLGERVIDIHQKFTQGNAVAFMPDNKMKATARRIFAGDKYKKQRLLVMKSTYADLTEAADRAMWIRIYDETYNPRGYRVLSPEGNFVGEPSGKAGWGSLVEISKAVRALEDPSLENLTAIMGTKHKVRNFYNNILAPNAPVGDVTIDTHAVAAALLRPLSGGSAEVHHNFGSSPSKDKQPKGWTAARNINDNGAQGTYGIYAEAYRRAAKRRGVKPRELQSITWEAARGLYTAKFKQNANNVAAIDAIWYDYQRGKIDLAETRSRILEVADGIGQPDWVDQRDTDTSTIGDTSYAGELARLRVSRRDPGRLDAGSGDPGGTGELFQTDDRRGVGRLRSAARRAVINFPQDKATGKQWRAAIAKAPNVKQEELDWIIGLDEFLNTTDGPITRDQVRDFLDQNSIQMDEVVLDERESDLMRPAFTQYTMPGPRENEREFYLNLPEDMGEANATIFDWTQPQGHAIGEFVSDTRNVVRIRTNVRVLADGQRVLFIEEIQDDRGQRRRQEQELAARDFDPRQIEVARLLIDLARAEDADTDQIVEIARGTFADGPAGWHDFKVALGSYLPRLNDIHASPDDANNALYALYEVFEAEDKLKNFTPLTPDRPFMSSNKVVPLALKRAIIEAVEQDLDAISWTPGDVQNARWGRGGVDVDRYQIDRREREPASLEKNVVGKAAMSALRKAGYFIELFERVRVVADILNPADDVIAEDVLVDGREIVTIAEKEVGFENPLPPQPIVYTVRGYKEGGDNASFVQQDLTREQFVNLVGEDAARRFDDTVDADDPRASATILAGEKKKVGGEPMRAFYDKLIGNIANNLGKKYGKAKVGVGETQPKKTAINLKNIRERDKLMSEAGYASSNAIERSALDLPLPEPVDGNPLDLSLTALRDIRAKLEERETELNMELIFSDFAERIENNSDGFFPYKMDLTEALEATVPNTFLDVENFPGYEDLTPAQKTLIDEYIEAYYDYYTLETRRQFGIDRQQQLKLAESPRYGGYPLDVIIPASMGSAPAIEDRMLWNQLDSLLSTGTKVWTLPITEEMREAVLGDDPKGALTSLFQDPGDPLGSFNPTERVINLFENADQSTLLHESGHAFVDILGRLVARGDAPQRIVDNYNAMLEWVGASNANDLNLDINGEAAREKQERLAQAFEAYLMEGQAPSPALQNAFQMFRQWLINIYRRIRRLEVQVDPTISAVFDRMLATDNEIAEMEEVNAFDFTASPSITSIMSPEERARHDALSAAASEAARNERAIEERAAEARAQQEWYQEEFERARERAEAAVYERPEYKAFYFLTRGELYAGDTPANLQDRRISKQALLDLGYTQEQLNNLPRGARRIYTTKEENATDPELIAAYFGFDDVIEMMDVFLSMRPVKDAIEFDAGTIMRSEHGDPMNDGTMERITEERLFNDERYQAIEAELDALARQTGQQAVGRRLVKAIVDRVFAEETVGGLLTPMRYQAASVRAAREAERAAANGDYETAFMKKRQQLLNHEMFRRSLQARDEIQKISQKMKGYRNRTFNKNQVDLNYIAEIKAFLTFFEFGQRSRTGQVKAEEAKRLMDFIEARQAKGLPIILPGELVEVASLDPETGAPNVVFKTKHWRDMTLPELRGLRDMADNLYKIARDNSQEAKQARRQRGEELADGILASTRQRRGQKDPLAIPTREEQVKESRRSGFSASHRKMESMLYQLDGFKNLGPMWRATFEKLARASDVKTMLVEKARKDFDDAVRIYDKATLKIFGDAKSAVAIPSLGGARFTREQRVAIALNWGTESNREALLEDDTRKRQFGALWNEESIQQILETLDDADWAFVQKIWTDIDSYWEDIKLKDGSTISGVKSLEMEQTGIAPPKVEASPFVVGERELPGGYYPLIYDNLSDARAHKESEQDLMNKLQSGGFTRAATSHGFTIARVGSGGRPIRLDTGVLYAHLDEVTQDLAYREGIQQAAEILGNNDVQDAIRATMGEPFRKALENILLMTANGNMHSSGTVYDSPRLRTARLNVTIGVMGFNIRSLLTQPLGLTQSIARIGAKEVGKGVAWFFSNPAKINQRIQTINDLSPYMADRAKTMTRELDDMTSQLGKENKMDKIRQFGYAPMVFLDVATVAYPTWWGAYDSAMNGRVDGIDAADEKSAILYADNIVRVTQGSGGAQNLSTIQQSSEAMKLLTMFYGYFNTTYNLQVEAYNRARADGSSIPRAVLKKEFLGQTMMLQIIPAILAGLLLEKWPDEEEEEEDPVWAWTKWSLAQFVNHTTAQMAIVRDIGSGITSPFGFSVSAAESYGEAVVDLGKTVVKLADAFIDDDKDFDEALTTAAAKKIVRGLGYLGGIPGTTQIVRTADYLYKYSQDDLKREPENVVDFFQGAVMLGDR